MVRRADASFDASLWELVEGILERKHEETEFQSLRRSAFSHFSHYISQLCTIK